MRKTCHNREITLNSKQLCRSAADEEITQLDKFGIAESESSCVGFFLME